MFLEFDLKGELEVDFDYHFWYQLYDGTWANKHGDSYTEWLGEDTPFSTNTTGWSVYLGSTEMFYDSAISSFIINVS